ncbi:Protein takeout [Frankliniella fusca]|uniref:Protein takeout n=1 Tax=Frankliniella fusca TaxID=407009 RepID=A0AAE1H7X2_9NEOP|nr:Protein takeout [Frankliniella fusca]
MTVTTLAVFCVLLIGLPKYGETINKLPPYISPCRQDDPKLGDCILKNAKATLPKVINGEPKYRVPNLDPLLITELKLRQGTDSVGLKLAWKNAEFHGLKSVQPLSCEASTKTRHIKFEVFVPQISITGTYSATGRVLLLPVTGSGPSNITVQNMKVTYEMGWDVVKKNGKDYMDIVNNKITLRDIGFMTMKFENFFNGDRILGGNMNRFLNENWKELAKEFGPGVADAMGEVFLLLSRRISEIVPYDIIFKS